MTFIQQFARRRVASATRIGVEPVGTPVGSLDDLFGQFEEGTEPASEDTETVTEGTEAAPPTTS